MDERYLRNLSALTEGECRLLRSKRILVVGCGGLGGYLIDKEILRIVRAEGKVNESCITLWFYDEVPKEVMKAEYESGYEILSEEEMYERLH